jgi:hypothetical protein
MKSESRKRSFDKLRTNGAVTLRTNGAVRVGTNGKVLF